MNAPVAAPSRVLAPLVAPENRAYWDAAARGELRLPHCRHCDRLYWYPRPLCPRCFSEDTDWQLASGRGTVYSYTRSGGAHPTIVAYVRLEEGVTLLSQLVHCEYASLHVGLAVRLCFESADDGQPVPMFTPA